MANKVLDITGQRFGRLTALKRLYSANNGVSYWLCKCDCGNEVVRGLGSLRTNRNHSCGCWIKEGNMCRRHSACKTITYRSWSSIKARCKDKTDSHYADYGGRGIKVCDRWLGKHGFENFLADMGERPGKEYSIDRIDVNGNYEPSNCRWATAETQANNKRSNIYIEHNGERHSICDWSRSFGVDAKRARKRYYRGLSFERIFEKSTLPKPGSKGTLIDDEVRFIRNYVGKYEDCSSSFLKEYGKILSQTMYYNIRAKRAYADII